MKQYHDLCNFVLNNGTVREDRTGTGTISKFGYQMRFDLNEGFPLLTTKRVPFRIIVEELLWFLNGETNIKSLVEKNVNIWNADAYREYKKFAPEESRLTIDQFIDRIKNDSEFAKIYGELGPIYGYQWRSWEHPKNEDTIDQIAKVISELKSNPMSRRHIVSAWNVSDIPEMALPPCHVLFQFYVDGNKLSCHLYQRSGDIFLGVPFNIASYSLLTMMVAQQVDLELGEFIHTLGDCHIYTNHIDQVKLQLSREPLSLPTVDIRKEKDIFSYNFDSFKLNNYNPHPAIKGDISV